MGLGFLSAATGVGSFIALVGVASLGDYRRKSLLISVNAGGAGLALLGFALAPSLAMAIPFAMFTMGFLMAYDINLATLLQLVAPAGMRGRILSLYSLAIGFMSLGGFVTGAVGSVIGVPTMLAVGGAVIVVNTVVRRTAVLRVRED